MEEFFQAYYPGNTTVVSAQDMLKVYPKATRIINDAFATNLINHVHASLARPGRSSTSKFDTVLIRRGGALCKTPICSGALRSSTGLSPI
jgi:hypothetical protein